MARSLDASKQMRRARNLARADTFLEVERARECRCCLAIRTSTWATAQYVGLATADDGE
jgi:hypothetical protein